MGLFGRSKRRETVPASLTFTFEAAGHTYDDGTMGLVPTTLTIADKRTAVIGLNGSGKSTLLGLCDGTLAATCGRVTVTPAGGTDGMGGMGGATLDPSRARDRKKIADWVAHMTREDLSEAFGRGKGLVEYLGFAPAAIIADEPTKGLDERDAPQLARAVFSYDTQVVFATHDTTLLLSPDYEIDRAIILDEGHVTFDGSPRDAVAAYDRLVRERFEAARSKRNAAQS